MHARHFYPRIYWVNARPVPWIFPTPDRSTAAYRPHSATAGMTFTTDPTPVLSVDFPCGLLSFSPCSYIAGYFRLEAQPAATCSRWFPARGFFSLEDGGDTFLRNVG
jgi:hypothetical protein